MDYEGENDIQEPDGYLCMDCALCIANGEVDDADPSWSDENMRGDWAVSSHDEHCEEFSWAACDCCNSTLGGARYGAYLI